MIITRNNNVACSRLSVSEDDRKSERATSGIRSERDPGEKRRGREISDLSFFLTRFHSSPARFFDPPLTESLEQANNNVISLPVMVLDTARSQRGVTCANFTFAVACGMNVTTINKTSAGHISLNSFSVKLKLH